MEEKSLLRKIINFIKNIIKVIIIFILSIFKDLFSSKSTVDKKNTQLNKTYNDQKKDIQTNNEQSTLPEKPNTLNNPHNNNEESDTTNENDVILNISKSKLNNLNSNLQNQDNIIYTYELLQLYVEKELEHTYKDDNFKVKDASKEIKEKIKELEEKIIPKILEKIEDNKLTTDKEVKKEVEEVIKREMKEKPLFPKKEELPKLDNKPENTKTTKKEIYFVAKPRHKELNIPENKPNKVNKEEKFTSIPNTNEITEKLSKTPVMMVKNSQEIPKQAISDTIKNATITTTIIATNLTREFLGSAQNDTKRTEELIQTPQTINNDTNQKSSDVTELQEVEILKKDVDHKTKSIEELTDLQSELVQKIKEIKKDDSKKETNEKKEEIIESLIKDTELTAISLTTDSLINESVEELKKEEFEDKDYDRIERQIEKMLDDITNTYLRYESKMTSKQKAKLKAEEEKLRNTKEQISSQKSQDILQEQTILNINIEDSEIKGLQAELKRIDDENKSKVNEDLFKRMEKLDGMTKEQVANADKRVMLKRFNKASILLEMTSILSLPFIRNKFFFAFTTGLIIDNHFNFINAFFKRKINKYEPADLSNIRKGKDALNGALDITYKNLVELDYLEQQALTRYPELAYDPEFINEVTRLRSNLTSKYNRLMKKNKNMEKYYMKSKYQKKVLKKELKKELKPEQK